MKRGAGKMAIHDLDKRFGTIAIEKGFITEHLLDAALTAQVKDDERGVEHRLIGTILREKGSITVTQIDIVLKEMF